MVIRAYRTHSLTMDILRTHSTHFGLHKRRLKLIVEEKICTKTNENDDVKIVKRQHRKKEKNVFVYFQFFFILFFLKYFEFVEESRARIQIDACESLKSFNRTTKKQCPVVPALLYIFIFLSREVRSQCIS